MEGKHIAEKHDNISLTDINKGIEEIKRLIAEERKRSDAQFTISVSIAAMVLSLTFIPAVPSYVSGIVLFIAGLYGLIYGIRQSRGS